jgi:hypothetical protein
VATFLSLAVRLDEEQATTPRASGKWTPIQEATHLALTYREYTAVFRGGTEFELLVPSERAARYKVTVLPRILGEDWFPSGAAAPERVRPELPPAGLAPALAELEAAREEFHAEVRRRGTADPARTWNHPYFGPLELAELLELLTQHAYHHARFLPP